MIPRAPKAIVAQGEINLLLHKAVYTDADRLRILELLSELGLRDDDDGSEFVILRSEPRSARAPTQDRAGRGGRSWPGGLARVGRAEETSRR